MASPYAAAIPSPLPANDYADYLIHHTNNLALPGIDTVPSLLSLLSLFPSPSTPSPTYLALRSPLPEKIVSELRRCRGYLKTEWEEIATGRIKALLFLGRAAACRDAQDLNGEREELHRAYESYEAVVGTFLRQLTSLPQTTSARPYLALLIKVLLDLRALALLADKVLQTAATSSATSVLAPGSSQPQPHLEATARQLNKAFTACVADRNADIELSRKWATYRIVAILFRTYFKLKSLPLCRNILRALSASADLPPLSAFPRADRVTFRYYTGMLHFLGQEYPKALTDLTYAYDNCHSAARNQQVQILLPLIPLQLLLRGRLPSPQLLGSDKRLQALYAPFCDAIRGEASSSASSSSSTGPSLSSFEAYLASPRLERILVQKGLYLAIEAFRPILLRCVLKRLWVVREKATRLSFEEVYRSLKFAGWKSSSSDSSFGLEENGKSGASGGDTFEQSAPEIEWLLGGLIANGYMKGYLSHERRMLVLSNTNAFPPLRDVALGPGAGGIVG
ncbi:hypothetical protein BCV69DRAFT_306785 [Microstroma glucosiphilum]|uniref:PCI domain-containing protein n=1 Tax=Pseudomicrostroma glucosiphilum TaxID=1684307 RepID=A0A316U950_9BASI|nr:hypothetical protein BCV69DRAFT_306785 [Pseudomicrostroma glucosiphilum]PWN21679.1 hypothetical protein BCV69DRAFT_306785 [Pseudomicrostroma glucosiphilum]